MSIYDVSDCNPIDRVQELIANNNPEGFIIKLGETIFQKPEMDDNFVTFVNQVVAAGLPYGIYYVSHAKDEKKLIEEAQFINDKIAELLNGVAPELGVWWDIEVEVVKRWDICPDLMNIIKLMHQWWPSYGNKIGIYTGYSFFNEYMDFHSLDMYEIPIWVAQYGYHENSLKVEHPELNHVMWQFTTNDDNQDENVFYGFRE